MRLCTLTQDVMVLLAGCDRVGMRDMGPEYE